MDLQRKEQRLREAVESLTRHDDEPLGPIAAAIERAFAHAQTELEAAAGRRERAAAELEQKRQAKDAEDAAQRTAQAGEVQTLTASDVGNVDALDLGGRNGA